MAGPVLLLTMVVHLVSRTGQGNSHDHKTVKINRTQPRSRARFLLIISSSGARSAFLPLSLGSATQMIAARVFHTPTAGVSAAYGLPDELCGVVVPDELVLPELLPLGVSAPPVAELPPDRPRTRRRFGANLVGLGRCWHRNSEPTPVCCCRPQRQSSVAACRQ